MARIGVRMYTREEKTRILEELWASGLPRATAAARPGWPTRETLRRWEAQADAGQLQAHGLGSGHLVGDFLGEGTGAKRCGASHAPR